MKALKARDDRLKNLKVVAVYSALGLGTATGVFLLLRHFYKKARKSQVERRSLTEGDPSTYARQLKMAFDNDNWMGWGTNTDMVMQVFQNMPNKATYQKVQGAYATLYNRSLAADLEDELSSEEYNQVVSILSTKR